MTATRRPTAADNVALAYSVLRALAQRHPGVRALGDDAESLALEALVRAERGFDPARGCRFSTFATACIVRMLLTAAERRARRHGREFAPYNPADHDVRDGSAGPADQAAAGDDRRLAWELYWRLPRRERQAVRLHLLRGLPRKECARRLHLAYDGFLRLLARAVRRMRRAAEGRAA